MTEQERYLLIEIADKRRAIIRDVDKQRLALNLAMRGLLSDLYEMPWGGCSARITQQGLAAIGRWPR